MTSPAEIFRLCAGFLNVALLPGPTTVVTSSLLAASARTFSTSLPVMSVPDPEMT